MALWKDSNSSGSGFAGASSSTSTTSRDGAPGVTPLADAQRRSAKDQPKESVLAAGLTLEGKINGTGHVRIAGRFKGDVYIDGTLTLDNGARIEGQVKAAAVVVGGELIGNIIQAQQVDLRAGGRIEGDIKAGSFTVASGARMRGKVEFGWEGEAEADNDSLTESVITGTL